MRKRLPWLVIAFFAMCFVGLGVLVMWGGPTEADIRVFVDEVHGRDEWSTQIARWVSWLGAAPAVIVLAGVLFAVLDLRIRARGARVGASRGSESSLSQVSREGRPTGRRWRGMWEAWPVLIVGLLVLATESALMAAIKAMLGRARPPEAWRLAEELAPSFPSGHASASAAISVFCVLCMVTGGWRGWRLTAACLAAAGWMALIGWARLYLGVHWLTDVVAGLMLGASVATAAWAWAIRNFPSEGPPRP